MSEFRSRYFVSSWLIVQAAVATTIGQTESIFKNDTRIARLAETYSVPAVRDAIAKCLESEYGKAVPVLKQFSDSKDPEAGYVLARLYLAGRGVPQSTETARNLLFANFSSGHGPSTLLLAQLQEKNVPAQAVQMYKLAAERGEPAAYVRLGIIAENGLHGLRSNPQLAHYNYQEASAAGLKVGDYHLARCYDVGIGVSLNAVKATRLFREAAMGGVAVANTVMARRYFEGKGVEADPVAAVGWLTRGAQAGNAEAMVLLGQRFERGDVVGKDLNRAGQLYSAAAKTGDATGKYRLAMMYLNGVGTDPDAVRAYVLLESAQALPAAKEVFGKLAGELTADQLDFANKKIAEAKAKTERNAGN